MEKKSFDITGMSCSACSAKVEKTVSNLVGVEKVSVNLLKNSMSVEFDPNRIGVEQIVEAVSKIGYVATSKEKSRSDRKVTQEPEIQAMKIRLFISILFSIPLMWVAMSPMFGVENPLFLSSLSAPIYQAVVQIFLTLPVVVVNFHFFDTGFKALINRAPTMDSLVALSTSACIGFGFWIFFQVLHYTEINDFLQARHLVHQLYFDSASMILTLITLGKFLEARAKSRTTEAISRLLDLIPKAVCVERNHQEMMLSIDELVVGDVICLRTGDRIPADGIVIEGQSSVDESSFSGESIPVAKKIGSLVTTSTLIASGFIKMRAEKVGSDTAFAQIIAMVDEATSSKAPIARLADTVSGIFVPTVILISFASALTWLLLGYDYKFALVIGISVLVISCPCALGLATPTAIMVGTGKGAEKGILFKSAESIEKTGKVSVVILDKTGTITLGQPQVTEYYVLNDRYQERIWDFAYSLEKLSEHPLARAIVQMAKKKGAKECHTQHFLQQEGSVQAVVEGKEVEIGSIHLLKESQTDLINQITTEAKTPLIMKVDGVVTAIFAISDPIKEDSPSAIKTLKDMGLKVLMVTGDNRRTAHAIADMVGIDDVFSEMTPIGKEGVIRNFQEKGLRVMMVGDGINDAPSLARADVGCAIGCGTDVAIESADIVLTHSRLTDVVNALHLSHATMKNIKQNLFWAFFYNIVGIPIASGVFYTTTGWLLNPMIGAVAMSLSSFCVVTNALRLRHWKPVKEAETNVMNKPCELEPKSQKMIKEETQSVVVTVANMNCMHCANTIRKTMEAIAGIQQIEIHLDEKKVLIEALPEVSLETVKVAIEEKGYQIDSIEKTTSEKIVSLHVDGMMCPHCVASVEKALKGIVGVDRVEVSLEEKTAKVWTTEVSREVLEKTVRDLGYEVK
ncbi:MAG: cadmium-translocating P-type ATPase [Burkholderiaceae bacterium]|nr:cadmium-translocating P-type ATPase [Burkholderiaceae bacterium]